jgi:ATPase subunit of ABC transporter with duplicated ATPase domains
MEVASAEASLAVDPNAAAQLAYANALAEWEDAGGYAAEVVWDRCTSSAFGSGYPECAGRSIAELSGGELKRLALSSDFDVLLLDEPTDNLDVAAAEALEDAILRYHGTVIAVTHDRWFMRLMDRFLWFDADGPVNELVESPWADELSERRKPVATERPVR